MFQFDLSQEPLTNLELKTELQKLKVIRKQQIKHSCVSDVFHTFIFISLYFGQMLTSTAVMVAVAISTVSALILAMTNRHILKVSDRIIMAILAVGAAVAVAIILIQLLQQPLPGSLIATLLTGSIVIVGATLGRQIKEVMVAIEDLKQRFYSFGIIKGATDSVEAISLAKNTMEINVEDTSIGIRVEEAKTIEVEII